MRKAPLHPLTWWIWSFAVAISVARINAPIFAIASVGVVGVIVYVFREDAPWGKSFTWTLKLAAWILLIRTFIAITIGIPIPGTTIFTLPRIPLPSWMPGVRIGGAVTLERLSSVISEGLIICAIIVIFGAAASLTSPHRLLRVLPVYMYEFGVSVVISTTILPQLVTSFSRIRMAQRLRGQSTKGFASYRRVAIPLLEESLARSLDLAAAMDSRGYGISRKRSRYRPITWKSVDTAIVATGLIVMGLS
ncbi:MAG: energy-coupling factor transport system permease protein [Actinobacteria bacterium]|nr:energy-coupling factor transport system permease protein [Actinomycetota bacterium]